MDPCRAHLDPCRHHATRGNQPLPGTGTRPSVELCFYAALEAPCSQQILEMVHAAFLGTVLGEGKAGRDLVLVLDFGTWSVTRYKSARTPTARKTAASSG